MEYVTADIHAYHHKIITLDKRPFKTIDEMHDTIVNNINEKVRKNDTLYILGDFCFGKVDNAIKFRNRINCEKIILVAGNHDRFLRRKAEFQKLFIEIVDLFQFKAFNKEFVLCHYPLAVWNKKHHKTYHLHGHSHGNYKPPEKSLLLDVCIALHNYKPLSLLEVIDIMNMEEIKMRPIKGKNNYNEIITGYFHEWSRDADGDIVAIVEDMNGYISFLNKDIQFLDIKKHD